jgi:hypothetical protein
MDGNRRLAVLERHLTAGSAAAGACGVDAAAFQGLCAKELARYLTHDNPELRGRIFEFLKVGSSSTP